MSRLKRFEHHRFIGDRRTMKVYDCDDPEEFAELQSLLEANDLVGAMQIQTFAPDERAEALNRNFSASR